MDFPYGILFLLLTMNEHGEARKEFKVGDAEGWRVPDAKNTYKQWASKVDFHVGDSLRFEYKRDSVLVVYKWGYYHCNASKPISTFKDGNTLFNLTKPGPIFFISGDETHCDKGQRLAVNVEGPNGPKKSGQESVSVKLLSVFLAIVTTSVVFVF